MNDFLGNDKKLAGAEHLRPANTVRITAGPAINRWPLTLIFTTILCLAIMAIPAAAQQAAPKAAPAAEIDFSEALTPGKVKLPDGDSLEYVIRNDYLICTGDTAFIPRAQLFKWKNRIDSLVLADKKYPEKFKMFVSATGMKAHEIRPCEPIVFHDRLEKQFNEMDSIVSATRAQKEKARKDSITLANELANLKIGPVDLLEIPAGISKDALLVILNRNEIKTKAVQNYLQAENLKFDSLAVTIAFYFDRDNKFNGYEIETAALKADQLDKRVRGWAAHFSNAYEKKLGPPTAKLRVGFRDIKQGHLSIVTKWDKSKGKPRALVGLATHNNLYYAKVMVNY